MAILISGGAGYVGSHTCVELLNAGEDIIVFDNFFNSGTKTLDAIRKITGKDFKFYEADMLEIGSIDRIFDENEIEQVIHFAGYKSIPESVKHPLKYYSNNLRGTFNILETMRKYGCTKFIFSSTAATCRNSDDEESNALLASNPYGSTKLIIENLCREMYNANKVWTFVLLRYLNTMGAHKSGLIGEDISGRSDSLMSAITARAVGKSAELQISGDDYPTPDGTCVRDCVHVEDLAKGHVAAVKKARETESGCSSYDLGSGSVHSVKEIIETFKRVNSVEFDYTIGPRRDGDVAESLCDPSLAEKDLGWKAEQSLEDMCRDAWNFVKRSTDK